MARSIRIQYEGAYYHVMARGNHQEKIFLDDADRNNFLKALDEVCEMTGWQVHAWVLMDNHYHLFIQTPEANLVEGMKWLQNTYTRRFNVRHKAWGRLFGDRYKAILVEGDNRYYYETLLDYIHLNPVRAGLINLKKQESVLHYPWSSLVEGYALPPSKRKTWMSCSEGLKSFALADTADGRRKMIKRLDQRAAEERKVDKPNQQFETSWYLGTKEFSARILSQAKDVFKKQRSRAYNSAAEHKEHGLQQAQIWLREALVIANLSQEDLLKLNGSDSKKVFLALFLKKKTTVSNIWLAEHLKMKSAANVSHCLNNIEMRKLQKNLPKQLIDYAKSQQFEI